MTLAVGIALFDDGQSFRELLTVASDRCTRSSKSSAPSAAAPVVEPASPPIVAPQAVGP